ncbi:hypothetical protein N7490_002250 [Penicillium lividum]|nr:hypothetical protein N7490_002250 [Penicillium lividum]
MHIRAPSAKTIVIINNAISCHKGPFQISGDPGVKNRMLSILIGDTMADEVTAASVDEVMKMVNSGTDPEEKMVLKCIFRLTSRYVKAR